MVSNGHFCILDQFQNCAGTSIDSKPPVHQQWPWRGLAFCSDFGTVGYLVNKPKLGIVGWALALPYYFYAIFKQPKGEQQRQELLYQATANGIFPFVEAKAGVGLGDLLHRHVITQIIQKYPTSALSWLTQPRLKIAGGITALLVLTPTVGDPISQWVLKQYKIHLKEGQTG